MLEFANTLKLYGFRNENRVSLSIRSSPVHVLTFYLEGELFELMLREYSTARGAELPTFLVHRKGSYVRFTHRGAGLETNLRVPTDKWESMVRDYRAQMADKSIALITCVVE